jgi:hypothetical protein
LLVPALHIDCARSATGLAPKISRAGISLPTMEPDDIPKHVQQKNEILLQAKQKMEADGYTGQGTTSSTSRIPCSAVVVSLP